MFQDFSGKNLAGHSFFKQNLEGANFSSTDIRGADFTGADLKGANFISAQAGLQLQWLFFLFFLSCLLSILSGFFWLINGYFVALILVNNNLPIQFPGWISSIILIGFYITTIYKGLIPATATATATAFVAVAVAASGAVATSGGFAASLTSLFSSGAVAVSLSTAGTISGAVVGSVAASLASAVSGVVAKEVSLIVAGSVVLFIVIFIPGVFVLKGSGSLAGIVAIAGIMLNAYISSQAMREDKKYSFVRSLAIAVAATGGTSFCNANLTDTDFTETLLRNTKFSKTNLTRTRFYKAKKLDLASVGNSILANSNVLNLLVTYNGKGINYSDLNLIGANLIGAQMTGANLKGANINEAIFEGANLEWANLSLAQAVGTNFTSAQMTGANLKGANINEAIFEGANLEWANLSLAQAVGTNFTSAQMTGACIEAWNTKISTKLDNIDCKFIYLLEYPKPKTDDRERRPPGIEEFKPGDFTTLFEEALKTVDLIFREGIDWITFIAAFRKVQAENKGTKLTLQSVESKGDGLIVIRVLVSENAKNEKIYSELNLNYELEQKATEQKYQLMLQAKDNEIAAMYSERIIEIKEIYAQFVSIFGSKPININNILWSEIMSDLSRKIEISGTVNASGAGALSLGDISGTVANTINQLPSTSEPNKPGIKELLERLKTAIESESNLSDEDKSDALEHIQTLAEAGQKPKEGAVQKTVKTAIQALKGIFSSLPDVAKLAEAGKTLIPLVAHIFGL